METLHTVLNRGCSIWDRNALPESEFRGRLDKVRSAMKERRVELLLAYGDSWRFGNLAYLSHFIPKNRGALAVVPIEGEPALVVQEPSRNNPFSKTLTWIDEVRSVGQFAQGLDDALKARGLKPKRVGLASVEQQLNIREWNALLKLLDGAELSDLGDLLASLRALKSGAEQAMMRKAGSILESSLDSFTGRLAAGQKEYEAAAIAEREARRQGVEDFRFLIARSSEPEVGLRPAGPSPLVKGEGLLVAVAASYQRYWAEIGRTFSLGRPPERVAKAHAQAKALFGKVKERVISGRPAAELLPELPAAARSAASAYGLGNGVGLELSEPPEIGSQSGKIPPGTALTLRLCFSGKDYGSALISQPFLARAGGLDPLVRGADELAVV